MFQIILFVCQLMLFWSFEEVLEFKKGLQSQCCNNLQYITRLVDDDKEILVSIQYLGGGLFLK